MAVVEYLYWSEHAKFHGRFAQAPQRSVRCWFMRPGGLGVRGPTSVGTLPSCSIIANASSHSQSRHIGVFSQGLDSIFRGYRDCSALGKGMDLTLQGIIKSPRRSIIVRFALCRSVRSVGIDDGSRVCPAVLHGMPVVEGSFRLPSEFLLCVLSWARVGFDALVGCALAGAGRVGAGYRLNPATV